MRMKISELSVVDSVFFCCFSFTQFFCSGRDDEYESF